MTAKQGVYLPNLNGLRFIAAAMVIVHHIEQLKSMFSLTNYWGSVPSVFVMGKLGVVLFFVLSGFLITYLLLKEEQSFGTISIKKFYIRRVLRIWPLYFLIVFLGFLVLPNLDFFLLPGFTKSVIYSNWEFKIAGYLLMIPNVILNCFGIIPYASHLWSIGVEEQFYLIWPVLFITFRNNRPLLIACMVLVYFVIDYLVGLTGNDFVNCGWKSISIIPMAIGALFGIILFKKGLLYRILTKNLMLYVFLLTGIIGVGCGYSFPFLNWEIYSLIFGVIMLNLSSNQTIPFSLEQKPLKYLGNISFGLYMYHPILIVFTIHLGSFLGLETNWFFYPVTFILTIAISAMSYTYFEKPFLKYKVQFSQILSNS